MSDLEKDQFKWDCPKCEDLGEISRINEAEMSNQFCHKCGAEFKIDFSVYVVVGEVTEIKPEPVPEKESLIIKPADWSGSTEQGI